MLSGENIYYVDEQRKGKKEKVFFLSGKESYLSFFERKKTFYFFLSSFWERKDIFLSLLKLKKSFLSLLSFCRFEKIFLSFLFRNEKVIFLSRGKVFFLAHPWLNLLQLKRPSNLGLISSSRYPSPSFFV